METIIKKKEKIGANDKPPFIDRQIPISQALHQNYQLISDEHNGYQKRVGQELVRDRIYKTASGNMNYNLNS